MPTFLELKKFISDNPKATICETRDYFNQHGDAIISITYDGKKRVVAFNINSDFYMHLDNFMQEEYVICGIDPLACIISDKTKYIGKGKFLPIVLSIKK